MNKERTFAMIKPNAILDGNMGKIISEIEPKFKIIDLLFYTVGLSESQAKSLYEEHKGKEFYDRLIKFSTSGPVVVMILEAPNAVQEFRTLMKSIRLQFSGKETHENAIHGSDSIESAKREIELFFFFP